MKKAFINYIIMCGILFNIIIFSSIAIICNNTPDIGKKLGHIKTTSNTFITKLSDRVEHNRVQREAIFFEGEFNPSTWPTIGPVKAPIHSYNSKRKILINNEREFKQSIERAKPGDELVIKSGNYHFNYKRLEASKEWTSQDDNIILRSEVNGEVNLFFDSVEAIIIESPNWIIDGLNFVGSCNDHSRCEHALHVVGNAQNIVIRNNTFYDFNAALKINELNGIYPDNGLIEHNIFGSSGPRKTNHSITPINLDHGNNWIVRANLIHDFIKEGGNQISYGAFMKGGIENGVFERNLIICNTQKRNYDGSRVGLSLGGGGMEQSDRRNNSIYESINSKIRNNIIIHCNDVGIYNQLSSNSTISNNLLFNTFGIDTRYKSSPAIITNNIVSNRIKNRDNAQSHQENNLIIENSAKGNEQYYRIFKDPKRGVFNIINPMLLIDYINNSERQVDQSIDFCNHSITKGSNHFGAIYNDSDCFIR